MKRIYIGAIFFILYLIVFQDLLKPLSDGNIKGFLFNLIFPLFVILLVILFAKLIKKLEYDDFKLK